MRDHNLRGVCNRILQAIARGAPGAMTIRPMLHRWRGVKIAANVWIGYDCILETSRPYKIQIKKGSVLSMRVMLIAHFIGPSGIQIGENVFVGPGSVILPNVTIGDGAVVAAGSVVTHNVGANIMVQGNPAKAMARVEVALAGCNSLSDFQRGLRPL